VVAWSNKDSHNSDRARDEVTSRFFIENDNEKEERVQFSRYCKLLLKEAKHTSTQQVKSLSIKTSRDY